MVNESFNKNAILSAQCFTNYIEIFIQHTLKNFIKNILKIDKNKQKVKKILSLIKQKG